MPDKADHIRQRVIQKNPNLVGKFLPAVDVARQRCQRVGQPERGITLPMQEVRNVCAFQPLLQHGRAVDIYQRAHRAALEQPHAHALWLKQTVDAAQILRQILSAGLSPGEQAAAFVPGQGGGAVGDHGFLKTLAHEDSLSC